MRPRPAGQLAHAAHPHRPETAVSSTHASRPRARRISPAQQVCLLIIPALFLVAWPCSSRLPQILSSWGLTHPVAQAPVANFVTVSLNAYVSLPLVTTVAGHWLARPRGTWVDTQPWKALDEGFRSQWSRSIFVALLIVPSSAVWIVNEVGSGIGGA